MLWSAIASSTLASERTPGLANAAPSYQQKHTKPLFRSSGSSWQLSNAAFKSRQLMQQHHQQVRQLQKEEEEAVQQEQISRINEQPIKDSKNVKNKKQQAANCKKKISLKSGCKIFKAFISCKCIQK